MDNYPTPQQPNIKVLESDNADISNKILISKHIAHYSALQYTTITLIKKIL